MNHDVRKNLDWDYLRTMIAQWRTVAPYYMGDYYPLTPDSLKRDDWMAWQFDCPEKGEGVVHAFRRAENDELDKVRKFRLRSLGRQAQYAVVNFDSPEKARVAGRELMEKGLVVNIPVRPGAVVITYKKIR
jgi:alpha-galactosidase